MHIGPAGKLSLACASRILTNALAYSVGRNRGSCMKTLNGIPYFLAPLVMLVGYVLNSHSLIFKVLLKILKAQLTFLKFHRNVWDFPILLTLHAWSIFVVRMADSQANWLASLSIWMLVGNVHSLSWLSEICFPNQPSILLFFFLSSYFLLFQLGNSLLYISAENFFVHFLFSHSLSRSSRFV